MTKGSRPANYSALVALDVDGLGNYFEQLPGERDEFRRASETVIDQMEGAVQAACRKVSDKTPKGEVAPFEILWLGGDDAVVVMQAQFALPFLDGVAANFSVEGLTFSAGIVWANRSFPIAQAVELAGELLDSAKEKGGGRVDSLVVTEALARRISERPRERTRKPYCLAEYSVLGQTIAEWKKAAMPSTKVAELFRIAHEEPTQAEIDYLFLLSRLSRAHRDLMLKSIPDFWEDKRTRAADLAELWDLVALPFS